MAGDQEMTEAEEFATFDFLASYAPTGPGSTSQGPSTAPHEDERDAKWQRRDASNKGNPGKGRGLPKRERETYRAFGPASAGGMASHGGPQRGPHRDTRRWGGSGGGGGGYGGGGDGDGMSVGFDPHDPWNTNPWNYATPKEIEQLRGQVQMLQKIVLRHEDALSLMRQEVGFIIHFRIGVEASLVKDIYQSQLGWRELRKSNPEKVQSTLRNTLMECVLKVLLKRIQQLESQDQAEVRDKLGKARQSRMAPLFYLLHHLDLLLVVGVSLLGSIAAHADRQQRAQASYSCGGSGGSVHSLGGRQEARFRDALPPAKTGHQQYGW